MSDVYVQNYVLQIFAYVRGSSVFRYPTKRLQCPARMTLPGTEVSIDIASKIIMVFKPEHHDKVENPCLEG